MIREDKLRALADSPEDFQKLFKVARVISEALGKSLDYVTALAVIDVFSSRQIWLTDGTAWNDSSHPQTELGVPDAAAVVSVLTDDPDQDWSWWRQKFIGYEKDDAYEAVVGDVIKALSQSPVVKGIEP